LTTVWGTGLERGGAVAPVARDEPGDPALGDPVLAGHLGLGTAFNGNSGDEQASFRHQPTLAEPARDCPPSSVGQPPTDPLITAAKSVGVTPTTTHQSPTGPSRAVAGDARAPGVSCPMPSHRATAISYG